MKEFDLTIKVKKSLRFWSIMSVLFVVAIPIMVISLVKLNWWIAVPCIAVVGINFYALPIGWVYFAFLKSQRNVYLAITGDNILEIKTLASTLGSHPRIMLKRVQSLISGRYLRGYVLNNEKTALLAVEKPKPEVKKVQTHCISCGAVLPVGVESCSYCGCAVALTKS